MVSVCKYSLFVRNRKTFTREYTAVRQNLTADRKEGLFRLQEGVSKSNLSEVRWKLIRFQRMEVNGQ